MPPDQEKDLETGKGRSICHASYVEEANCHWSTVLFHIGMIPVQFLLMLLESGVFRVSFQIDNPVRLMDSRSPE